MLVQTVHSQGFSRSVGLRRNKLMKTVNLCPDGLVQENALIVDLIVALSDRLPLPHVA
jgi:hypothetical protein